MEEESKLFQTFFYQGHQIRTVEHKGETWWVASDVCKVLEHSDTSVAVSRLDDDEKLIQTLFVSGQNRNVLCVNEPGLYTLILTSRTPNAKVFGRWIRHEVLPAIRKTGRYSLAQEEPQTQPAQCLNWDAVLITTLSKDEHMRLIRYERARLSFLESAYDFKYPLAHDSEYSQVHNSEYPQEEQKPQPIETIVIPTVDTKSDAQTILLDYLHKTGSISVTVRQLQQSGPRQLRNLPADHLRAILQALVTSGVLTADQVGKSEHYRLL